MAPEKQPEMPDTEQLQVRAIPTIKESKLTGGAVFEFEDAISALKSELHVKLQKELDPVKLDEVQHDLATAQVMRALTAILGKEEVTLSKEQKEKLILEVTNEVFALGPLEPLLTDPTVDDVLVNRSDQVYVERLGHLHLTNVTFRDERHVRMIIDRIVERMGRRIDYESPMVDARLPDGSRVNAVIPPLVLKGSVLSIRKFRHIPLKGNDLVRMGTCTEDMLKLLQLLVKGHFNLLISGGTGSGKTTLLNILSSYIPKDERIVTIEDAAELQLQQEHVVSMETRPPDTAGRNEVTQRALVRNALRMRPDRIIVGEVRGVEVLEMLQAMNTGHEGSIATIHANSPRDAAHRIELMMLYSGSPLPHNAIMRLITGCIHVIINIKRYSDGVRRIAQLCEITGVEGNIITMHDIGYFKEEGFEPSGRVRGQFVMSRIQPFFMEKLRAKGLIDDTEGR